MSRFDAAVIGAGVNGLACAALLAKAGKRVVVLERADGVGGLAAGDEFHPGYRTDGLLHDTAGLRPELIEELGLGKHGLELREGPDPVLLADGNGPGILLRHDPDASAAEIERAAPGDADAYRAYRAFFERIGKFTRRVLREPPPDALHGDLLRLAGEGLALRRLGTEDMLEVLRMGPMCVADWLNERFASPLLKAGLALPAVEGGFLGPWSPGTQANLILHEARAARAARGGPAAVVAALESAARVAGVEIRTGAAVERIRIADGGGVAGVLLAGGEEIDAETVAASCDPKTALLALIEPRHVAPGLARQVEVYRAAGTTAKVDLALTGPVRFAGREGDDVERAFGVETIDDLERAFDALKYGRFSVRPALDVRVPTVADPSRAPAGHAVASVVVHFAAFELAGGWTADRREELGDAAVGALERIAPGVRALVAARRVLAPPDIEARHGTTGGHIHHGDHMLDQLLVRPVRDCARYATPLPGLFLCGAGSHPGGGITGAPGRLAARTILAR